MLLECHGQKRGKEGKKRRKKIYFFKVRLSLVLQFTQLRLDYHIGHALPLSLISRLFFLSPEYHLPRRFFLQTSIVS